MRQRGSIPLAVLIGLGLIVLVVIGMAVCTDAIFEDEDETDDLGQPALVESRKDKPDRDGYDRSDGRNSRGDCEGSDECSDNDFSPTLTDSPIVVCVQPGACDFGEGESAAGLPSQLDPRCVPYHCDPKPTAIGKLDPEALLNAITTGSETIGRSAGEMAGAIAALPIAILL